MKSDLYYGIEQKFREVNVVIPFPQRDLHISGFDSAAGLTTSDIAVQSGKQSD